MSDRIEFPFPVPAPPGINNSVSFFFAVHMSTVIVLKLSNKMCCPC